MKEYLHIIQKELSFVSEADLYLPIKEAHIDSLDILVIRVVLEKHFNHVVSDATWYRFETLSEGLQYFHHIGNKVVNNEATSVKVELEDDVEIRMPQMANSALSENWLLKYLGDTHWGLLSKGLCQKSSALQNELGNRLYATFIRIKYKCTSLKDFCENDVIYFSSSVERFGHHTYLSNIQGCSNVNKLEATMMTTFSLRHHASNKELEKGIPVTTTNNIVQLSQTPSFLNDYRLLKKDLLEEYVCEYGTFTLFEDFVFSCEYDVNPFYDINGVGLLYFASYAVITDKCLLEYFKQNNPDVNFCDDYHTVFRDIFYFANCDRNDAILFQLNDLKIEDNLIKMVSSLYRKSDQVRLSKIITVKEKVEE